jgi:hypothetical protein
MNSINKTARMAGLLYFMYILTSVIANMFGKFVFVDAPVTVNHIMTHESQFRIGFVISLFSYVLFLLAAWYLYVLLEPVGKKNGFTVPGIEPGRVCHIGSQSS